MDPNNRRPGFLSGKKTIVIVALALALLWLAAGVLQLLPRSGLLKPRAFPTPAPLGPEILVVTETPAPDGPGIQAEISLLDTARTADKSGLILRVSILNTGAEPFNLTAADVALTPPGGQPLALVKSDPALPAEIGPGAAAREFAFTFPRPGTQTAVVKILGVEYDVEGY